MSRPTEIMLFGRTGPRAAGDCVESIGTAQASGRPKAAGSLPRTKAAFHASRLGIARFVSELERETTERNESPDASHG